MAYEAVLKFRTALPINFTCANVGGIEKGALLRLIDPMTVSGALVSNVAFAGVAAQEKISNNGQTELGIFREGIFLVYLSGACVIGDSLLLDGAPNYVKACPKTNTLSGAYVVGTALESSAGNEAIFVELNPHLITFT